MTEPMPDNSKRIAYSIGLGLHPASIAIGTLLILLWGLPLGDTIRWTALVASVVLIPIFATTAYLQRQDQYTYQRLSRKPIYLVAWIDVAICLGLILIFNGPTILGICMATLLVWLPLQLGINQFLTKISISVEEGRILLTKSSMLIFVAVMFDTEYLAVASINSASTESFI